MSQQNLIAVNIPQADLAEISQAIDLLRDKLLPHLTSLSAQDRHEMPKMGAKTLSFVQKSLEYAKVNDDLIPSFLDLEAMEVDYQAVQLLQEMAFRLNPVNESLNDSILLSGSEAYQGALVFYNNVKNAAKIRAGVSVPIYTDLAERFPGAPTRRKP